MTLEEEEEEFDEDELIALAEEMEEEIDDTLLDIKETKNTAQQIRQTEQVGINAQVRFSRKAVKEEKKRKRRR